MILTESKQQVHHVDFAVIGGGLAGMLAAVSAARHGAKVALMHDRPVFGGNCSSEIRMWALGCHGENNRETGILEEMLLKNMYRNPTRNFSIWDSILFETVRNEKNIELIMNCSAYDAQMDGSRIVSVTGWQLTTYTKHTVYAKLFSDCSGDSILAELCGAEYRVGREASSEFGEDIAPETADKKTMGMSCMLQARETDHKVEYIPPEWANVYATDEDLPYRGHDMKNPTFNYWWIELGGEFDSIYDTEMLRDELLKIAFGVWDHIKNRGNHGADNWELDWVGFLPGKRESRRMVGDHIMTQNDVRSGGHFDDLVAYGGWTMDDHDPGGIRSKNPPTIHHPAPAPYGIPYRCMYSVNIENLFFAGRNISTTHTALSSTRVMATCAIIGQAVGTAAAIAVQNGLTPRGVYEQKIGELKQTLMKDDCYLPFNKEEISAVCAEAALAGCENAEQLRNGNLRPIGKEDNGCCIPLGDTVTYTLKAPAKLHELRITVDSDLNRTSVSGHKVLRNYPTLCNRFADMEPFGFPTTVTKELKVEIVTESGVKEVEIKNNIQRLIRIDLSGEAVKEIRVTPTATWGKEKAHIFGIVFD